MIGPRGIIFDCDGVLFESRQANLAYYNAVLDEFGVAPVSPDDRERAHLCHTAASPRVFEVLLGPALAVRALEVAAAMNYRRFIPHMTPEPGMAEALSLLSAKMPLAVATNRGTSMPEILEYFDLSRYFSAVVTCRHVPRPKPYPDMLLMAARELGLGMNELLFVGDSELDRDAARSAGVPFAAYKWQAEGARTISGHGELVEWVLGMPGGQGEGST
ncbi:haloacid dehalogenase [Desulfuromonas versatilis]|uniref:phosphoglycolate phosphatase n=1 Tax=Desulfuromonas versatilis TaxID=2802975 RepID=A0ABN6DZA9_9BACT|nr:HAD family hydrolase [Desulfuromonas versatilis]BCR05413.1 haloacid dehalogenase [Desulfuromonas versatilis]